MKMLFALALMVGAPGQNHGVRMLPPDADDGFTSMFMAMFREPPLWTPGAAAGYRSRMRVTLLPNIDLLVSVRIDEREDGKLVGTAVTVQRGRGDSGYRVRKRSITHFKVSRAQMDTLEQLLAKADTWKFERTHWEMEGMMCIDGLPMIFERVNVDGYRYAEANAICDAPPSLNQAAQLWLRLAGVTYPWGYWMPAASTAGSPK